MSITSTTWGDKPTSSSEATKRLRKILTKPSIFQMRKVKYPFSILLASVKSRWVMENQFKLRRHIDFLRKLLRLATKLMDLLSSISPMRIDFLVEYQPPSRSMEMPSSIWRRANSLKPMWIEGYAIGKSVKYKTQYRTFWEHVNWGGRMPQLNITLDSTSYKLNPTKRLSRDSIRPSNLIQKSLNSITARLWHYSTMVNMTTP